MMFDLDAMEERLGEIRGFQEWEEASTTDLALTLVAEVRKLRAALADLLKCGEHDGPCDNEGVSDEEPCTLHLAASARRRAAAQELLGE